MDPLTNTETLVGAGTGVRVERILCPVDFSATSTKAYRYAESVAGHYRAALVVQHVVELEQFVSAMYAPSWELFEEFRKTQLANARQELQQLVSTSGSVLPEFVVQDEMPADAILSLARGREMSLIVMGTHGRRGFDHLMLGSVTERVLRHATCPVLVIPRTAPDPGGRDVPADSVSVQRILCCVDFSTHSQRALEHALSLASAYGGEVTLLHALDGISESADVGKETAAAMVKLQKLLPTAGNAPKTHLEVRLGRAYLEIHQFVSETRPDVIVAGVRGSHALDLAVFGSTIYRVIQLSSAPVLAVPN